MKRRIRKRTSKRSSNSKRVDVPKAPSEATEISNNGIEKPDAPSVTNPLLPSQAPVGADRRVHPRYQFIACAEIMAVDSGTRIETRIRDLSQQGCYVDTNSPFALQTVADVHITRKAQSFKALARVVYSQPGKGMGLVFSSVQPEQLAILDGWVAESRETSWLAANRRRSQRVLMKIPVRVSGQNALGTPFEEDTQTLAVSAHGALIAVSIRVSKGQRLALSNIQTKAALECVVAHIRHDDQLQVGIEFILPNPTFWHVAFPPKDWTPHHPDAKPRFKAGK